MMPLYVSAQKQDTILNYVETFSNGTITRWKYNDQFSYAYYFGDNYGQVVPPNSYVKEFDFRFPMFNTANNRLGKDFVLTFEVALNKERKPADTTLYYGMNVKLTSFELGMVINGINRFQVIGLGDSCLPIYYSAKYQGAKKYANSYFDEISIEKKKDSILYRLNKKIVYRTRIISTADNTFTKPVNMSYTGAEFYAAGSTNFASEEGFVIDNFSLVWKSRPGDEMMAEQLLSEQLKKYSKFSHPYFGKYILATNTNGENCVLNKYGNYIIPPTTNPIRLTNQPGLFVKQDGGREEFYNSSGEYMEFNSSITKKLLASQKPPTYLQKQPLLQPLFAVLPGEIERKKIGNWIPELQALNVFSEGGKKGVRSYSGQTYIEPVFDSIYILQVDHTSRFSSYADDYRFALRTGGSEFLIRIDGVHGDKLLTGEEHWEACSKCNGKGKIEEVTYSERVWVEPETKTIEGGNTWMGIDGNRWQSKWKQTVEVSKGYYTGGEKQVKTYRCSKCQGSKKIFKEQMVYAWDEKTHQYVKKYINTQ